MDHRRDPVVLNRAWNTLLWLVPALLLMLLGLSSASDTMPDHDVMAGEINSPESPPAGAVAPDLPARSGASATQGSPQRSSGSSLAAPQRFQAVSLPGA